MQPVERRAWNNHESDCRWALEAVKNADTYEIKEMIINPTSGVIDSKFTDQIKAKVRVIQERDKTRIYSSYYTFNMAVIYSIKIVDKHLLEYCKQINGTGIDPDTIPQMAHKPYRNAGGGGKGYHFGDSSKYVDHAHSDISELRNIAQDLLRNRKK